MGKKAAAAASPLPEQEEPDHAKAEDSGELLDGDFVFPDGATYSGQYLKRGEDVCLHGEGLLQTGPESFQGTFEKGFYKAGRYSSCSGAVYCGTFRANLFHGVGEYTWPDGRVYRGTWKDGHMHGRGEYLNFSVGADKAFTGFSLKGHFASSRREQEEARRAFLAEYDGECATSASAALRDMLERCTAEGVPAQYLVPSAPSAGGGDELRPEEIVAGPYPAANAIVQATAQPFLARLGEASGRPLQVTVYEEAGQSSRFDGKRLKRQQLQHVGQAVEFAAPDAEAGALSVVVLVNISLEHDIGGARWKLAHCEVVQPPTS